ncbi:MAG: endonuclease [Candidatus Izemoplasmataceae bacterium]
MKKSRNALGIIVLIIAGIIFGAEYFLNVNLITKFIIDDQNAPEITIGDLPSKVVINTPYTINEDEITCEDDHDRFCEVDIDGQVDTSIVGEYTIIISATDSSGNEEIINFIVEVVEGVDGSFYIPTGYYSDIEGLTGEALKDALNDIITGHTEYPYTDDDTDVWDILRDADEDPDNPNNVMTFYSGISLPKDCQDTNTPPEFCTMEINGEMDTYEWNREHIWSKSRGDFSNASDLGAYTDTHHLVAAERTMNSIKNNRMYEDCHDGDDTNIEDRGYGNYTCNEWSFEPRDEVKGDVARMIFYMAVRYEGEEGDLVDLEVINDALEDRDSKLPFYGDLDDLLRWHLEDPVSEWEILRNQTIYEYQGNRNPFIDLPELVEMIWGTSEDYN